LQCVDSRDKSEEIHDVWTRLASSSYDVCSAVLGSEALMERGDADFHYLNDKCSGSLRNFLNENVFRLSQNEAEDEYLYREYFWKLLQKRKMLIKLLAEKKTPKIPMAKDKFEVWA
jgi:hypothetical protein